MIDGVTTPEEMAEHLPARFLKRILYRSDSVDCYGAAWGIRRALGTNIPLLPFSRYTRTLVDNVPDDGPVLMIGTTADRSIMDRLYYKCPEMYVLHCGPESSLRDLEGYTGRGLHIPGQSNSLAAWSYASEGTRIPGILSCLNDHLFPWDSSLSTQEVVAYLKAHIGAPSFWDEAHVDPQKAYQMGSTILKATQFYANLIRKEGVHRHFSDFDYLDLNTPILKDEVGMSTVNAPGKRYPLALVSHLSSRGDYDIRIYTHEHWVYSGADIAYNLGGGGGLSYGWVRLDRRVNPHLIITGAIAEIEKERLKKKRGRPKLRGRYSGEGGAPLPPAGQAQEDC